ncbi:hypothetical protein MA16_Dca021548 [Dendrobium catenatum]|uniref:RNase H type-1 domain-containing protein n=1 Tax=Dendrobium catenatum TaxID=906689 RepID=A0A2I0VTW5_9ASPA|nr:hypothetical protein MA16_Dca021548 [Dendrobium catenatum]
MKPFCVSWCKPILNYFKVNVAWAKVGNTFGYAGIIRNHLVVFISGYASPTVVEDMHMVVLMSVMSGIKLYNRFSINNIVLEANFPLVSLIDTGINVLPCAPPLFHFRRRIIEELNSFSHSFFVINKEVNVVALALAVLGTVFKNYKELSMDQLPVSIQGVEVISGADIWECLYDEWFASTMREFLARKSGLIVDL